MNALGASDIWNRISSVSREYCGSSMKNIFYVFNPINFKEGFKALDGSKARGIDNVSKKDYEKNLDRNIEKLLTNLHNGSYVPLPKREVLIPKANGKKRPIAIACTEDKLVEKVTANLLTSIYEPIFLRCSYGFRPNLSCHHAIKQAHTILESKVGYNFVVEIDLANFFNTVNHRILMKFLRNKIGSRKLLSLIHRQLVAKIETENGESIIPYEGTPQGGIVSPILANVFLHYVLDEWFQESYKRQAEMVRYADDAIFFFKEKVSAENFLEILKARLLKFKLQLNEDKIKIINFSKDSFEVFDFLGLVSEEPHGDNSFAFGNFNQSLYLFKKYGKSSMKLIGAIKNSHQCNPYVAKYLTGELKIPKMEPIHYSLGSKEEAIIYASMSIEIWKDAPELINILKDLK